MKSDFVEILGCDGTALYQNDNQTVKFSTSGRLQVLLAFDGMVMLKLNQFQYSVDPTHEIICDYSDPQFKMILYLNKYPIGKWILKINQHSDEVYSCLSQKCYIKNKVEQKNHFSNQQQQMEKRQTKLKKTNQKQMYQKEVKKEAKRQQVKITNKQFDQQLQQNIHSKITASSILVGTSKGIGWGLKMTGKVLSKGFQVVGGFASKAVKPVQNVQISENAKTNIQLAKKSSKTVLGFAATQVGNIIKFGRQTASNIGQRFEKTQKGKQMQENPKYQKVKSGTKTGVVVISNIYQGVVQAAYDIGSGISKGTSKVIGKKYGDEAGQAADDLFEGVGNVVKISRVAQDEAAKEFKE